MTAQTETRIKKHFESNATLVVDLVDLDGNNTQLTFNNHHEAIQDIPNLECEYDIYF